MQTVQEKLIRNKLGLLNLAQELRNVSKACRVMGYSRDTFYRYRDAAEEGGVEALFEQSRRSPNRKNRVDARTEAAVIAMATDSPTWGQVRVSNELLKAGIIVSPTGVRSVWIRSGLKTMKERLRALEEKVAREGGVLTEAQVVALEKKREDLEAHGEIETHHPGYLGSQDTFYVGTIKGVGRIYQQTFVDTYSKVALAKLYTTKTPITAADLLNDRVLPLLESQGMGLLRVLTDRGTEYCGNAETHEYQLFLAMVDIDHTKTKAKSPQTNGICERFHKTILQEFYQVAFRKRLYRSLDEVQADLDIWLQEYNKQRPHTGKHCDGKTPWQTLLDGKSVWKQKVDGLNTMAG
jgi:transposase InsO family protein